MKNNTALEQISQIDFSNELVGWESLHSADQQAVKAETRALAQTIFEAGKSRLKIGEHLTKVRDILEPRRMFLRYLKTLHFSRATAYRFIDNYCAAKTILPSPVMQVALMRGTDTINARLVKAMPPPRSTNIETINEYLDKVSRVERGKPEEGEEVDNETLKKECLNFVRTRYARLSGNSRTKGNWMRSLIGMMLALQGVANESTFSPEAIPTGYVRPRGRPRLDEERAG